MDKEGQNRKRKDANERMRKEVGLGTKNGILLDKKENERIGLTQHTNQM